VASKIVILTWDRMDRANQALDNIKKAKKDGLLEVEDAVVVVKDEEGNIKVKETEHLTTKKGVVYGGIAGLVIGTMMGGPIGGALLGGAAGALAGKIDLGIPNEEIEAVSQSMDDASSAIFAQVRSGNEDFLAAAIRESGGKQIEFALSEEMEADLEDTLSAATSTHQ
jgi:uncharacterized membrane protein